VVTVSAILKKLSSVFKIEINFVDIQIRICAALCAPIGVPLARAASE